MCAEVGNVQPAVAKQVTDQYVKSELIFVQKNEYIYVSIGKNLEEYTLNCYQRLPSEERV